MVPHAATARGGAAMQDRHVLLLSLTFLILRPTWSWLELRVELPPHRLQQSSRADGVSETESTARCDSALSGSLLKNWVRFVKTARRALSVTCCASMRWSSQRKIGFVLSKCAPRRICLHPPVAGLRSGFEAFISSCARTRDPQVTWCDFEVPNHFPSKSSNWRVVFPSAPSQPLIPIECANPAQGDRI
jgi:hypothetical protein